MHEVHWHVTVKLVFPIPLTNMSPAMTPLAEMPRTVACSPFGPQMFLNTPLTYRNPSAPGQRGKEAGDFTIAICGVIGRARGVDAEATGPQDAQDLLRERV